MKRILTSILLLMAGVISYQLSITDCKLAACHAENYPYRSDYLWVTEPDHADWLYQTGEVAKISVSLYKYGVPQTAQVEWEIAPDMLEATSKGTMQVKNGHAVFTMPKQKTPGFVDLRLKAVFDGAKTEHHIKVGYSVDKIQPYTKEPADFLKFWDEQKAELAKSPLKYTMEPAPEYETDKADAYLVRLDINKQKQCIYGYLFIPKGAKKGSCPAVMCPPGAGVKTIKEPLRHRYYADNGCIRFEIEIHGLDPRFTDAQFKEINAAFNMGNIGYFYQGINDRDSYYMKRVYLAMVRANDFLTSLPEWDGKNLAVQGGSQGGALALVTAGIDSRVTLCCANHPALTDMAGYAEKGRTGGYPHMHRQGMLTQQNINILQYYDVVNFVRHVKCLTRMTWGYNDSTCPPTTSYAAWNLLTCPKQSLITPINEHWTSEATEKAHCDWILENLK